MLLLPVGLVTLTLADVGVAQQSGNPPAETLARDPQAVVSQNRTPSRVAPPDWTRERHERILGVIPTFEVTDREHPPALTPGQKFRLFTRQAFDPFQWVFAGAQAGLSQSENRLPGYGQGAAGYGKRYGAAVADVTDHEFMSNFLFPVLLKQDPRYFRLGQGSIKHRFIYSLEQEFWCRTDRGTRQFNYSKVLGAFASKAVSNAYDPPADRGVGLTLSRSAVSLLSGLATNLGAEFWPDIKRKLFHR